MGPLFVALRARGSDRRTLKACRTVISPSFRQPGASKVDPFRSCMPWYATFTISHEVHTKKKVEEASESSLTSRSSRSEKQYTTSVNAD